VWRVGAKDRSKGATQDITCNQQDQRIDLDICRAWLSVVFIFLTWAIFPGQEPIINNNNSHRNGFTFGIFLGVIYLEIYCANVFGFCLKIPLNLLLIT
jgi:hypothetical protein